MAESPGFTHRDACTAIRCPECGAEPGLVCVDPAMQTVPAHDERIEEYRRLVFAAIATYEEEGMRP